MWVKICGNTNREDALLAAHLGADAVGFIFAPSVRQVNATQVGRITAALPASVERVGVFPAWSVREILAAIDESGLTTVQLHGGADAQLANELHDNFAGTLRIIHVIHWTGQMNRATFARHVKELVDPDRGDRVLVDSKVGPALGGTGIPFDWQSAQSIFAEQRGLVDMVLAGGLTPENVGEAIEQLGPWGVDIASGVEASAGRKDPVKLAAFIARAKAVHIT